MFYVFERDPNITIVGTVLDSDDGMVSRFTTGAPIPPSELPPRLTVEVEDAPDAYPDYFELQQIPIASRPLVDALLGAGVDNVMAVPVLLDRGGRTTEGYSILHIVGRVAALDSAKSVVTKFGPQIVRIKQLALAPRVPADHKIFRLHELQYIVLVTRDVRDAIAGFSGVVVSEAEGWSDSHQF